MARASGSSKGPRRPHRLAKALLVAGGLALLAAVFAAYLSPHMVVDLANRLWSCF